MKPFTEVVLETNSYVSGVGRIDWKTRLIDDRGYPLSSLFIDDTWINMVEFEKSIGTSGFYAISTIEKFRSFRAAQIENHYNQVARILLDKINYHENIHDRIFK